MAVLLALAAGCEDRTPAPPTGPEPRIITLAPALTTMAFDMGLGDHVVGVDQYSTLPPGESRPVVGSALSVRIEPILAVDPDVVLVNMQLHQFEPIVRADPGVRIEHFDLLRLADIARALRRIGAIVEQPELGRRHAARFESKLADVRERTEPLPRVAVMVVIGYVQPLMVGRGDFMHEMVELAGGRNVLADRVTGWKPVPLEMVIEADPRVIVCQAPPDQAAEARAYWRGLEVPDHGAPRRVEVVTDPRWTIPAPHLAAFTEELAAMLHPSVAANGAGPQNRGEGPLPTEPDAAGPAARPDGEPVP
jgi:iron complex transport system substrate-binding protein